MNTTKRDENAAWETEEQFRLLVQGVTDYAIYMLSPDGIVTSWNAGAERIKGYRQEEIIGCHFSCFYTEEDRKAGEPEIVLATAAKENRVEREGLRVRKDGSQFIAHIVVDALRDEAGTLIGFAKITRDITERTEAAAELEKANLALYQAQKIEAIGRIAGGIAHDFNNLLAVLSGSLDLLAVKSKNHLDMRIFTSMRRTIKRGSALTQQMLSFARQQPLDPKIFNLNTLISEFEPMLASAGNESIEMVINLEAKNAFALVDAARFETALLNLVVNSIDAMPDGGCITISTTELESRVSVTASLAAGRYVQVSVTDTGNGMSQEILAQTMEPFFTTKPIGKGTGLGLSQVYGFATQSGGDVVISSVEGKGTSVHLYFPSVQRDDRLVGREVTKNE